MVVTKYLNVNNWREFCEKLNGTIQRVGNVDVCVISLTHVSRFPSPDRFEIHDTYAVIRKFPFELVLGKEGKVIIVKQNIPEKRITEYRSEKSVLMYGKGDYLVITY